MYLPASCAEALAGPFVRKVDDNKEPLMGKEKNTRKDSKKKPLKTQKEKRKEKNEKKNKREQA